MEQPFKNLTWRAIKLKPEGRLHERIRGAELQICDIRVSQPVKRSAARRWQTLERNPDVTSALLHHHNTHSASLKCIFDCKCSRSRREYRRVHQLIRLLTTSWRRWRLTDEAETWRCRRSHGGHLLGIQEPEMKLISMLEKRVTQLFESWLFSRLRCFCTLADSSVFQFQ